MIVFPRYLSHDIKTIEVTSDVFFDLNFIPVKYTCDGDNVNPPLTIKNIPEETRSIVIIMEDLDAPIRNWLHWMIWDIPPTNFVKEKVIPLLGVIGKNDFGKKKYIGPCNPSGVHRYVFKIYALNEILKLKPYTKKNQLERIMSQHILGFGEITGLYKSVKNN